MATVYSDNISKVARHVFGDAGTYPVRRIKLSDLGEALRLGWDDFSAMPSHAVVLCVIYPVLGIFLFRMVLGYSVLPLLFPLAAGFALLGPFAATSSAAAASVAKRLAHGMRFPCCALRLSAP
jgi:uncharacterized membrane protein